METIIIGKPAMNIYLPLQEFPQEGDLFIIKGKNESVGNIGATSACLLAKWGLSAHFTGVVGNDSYAEKIRDTFKTYRVNSKFMETDFETGTAVNYNILNAKTGVVTKILYNDFDSQLKKFKYDFIPDFGIIDGTDFAGAHALLNNNGSVKTVFYGRIGDKDTVAMSKRCTWAVVTEKFAEMMTRETPDGSAEGYVNLYQKIVDASGKSNYIIILNSHKILYCVDGKVKMLPEMKINVADASSFDSIFVGSLSYALINNLTLDDAIKFANTAAAISLSRIGEVDAIPELNEVMDNSGLSEKFGLNKQSTSVAAPVGVQPLAPDVNVNASNEMPNGQEPSIKAFNTTANPSVNPEETPNSPINHPNDDNQTLNTNNQVPSSNIANNGPTPVNMLEPNNYFNQNTNV